MFCKWCGLESDTTDVCSWCRRPFSAPAKAAPTQGAAPAISPPPARDEAPAPARAAPVREEPVAPPPAYDASLEDDLSPAPFSGPVISSSPRELQKVADFDGLGARADDAPAPRLPQRIVPEPPTARAPVEPIPMRKPAQPPEPAPVRKQQTFAQADVIPVARHAPPPPQAEPSDADSPAQLEPQPAAERFAPPPVALPIRPATAQPIALNREAVAPLTEPRTPLGASRQADDSPDIDLPELDLPEIGESADDLVGPTGNRLDVTGAPPLVTAAPRPAAGPLPAFARPQTASTVTVPKAGGRTWYCRWCGMESDAPDRCSWCKRDLRSLPATTGGGKGPVMAGAKHASARPATRPAPTQRPPASGSNSKPPPKPVVQAAAVGAASGAATATVTTPIAPVAPPAPQKRTKSDGVPAIGTFQPQKSKYYADQVLDPVSGRHYDAETGQATDTDIQLKEDIAVDERVEQIRQTGIYLAGLVAMVVVGVGLVRVLPDWYLLFLAVTNVVAGMAMPVLRVVPFGEDDSSDVPWGSALILVLGPIVGGMAYGVLAVMRQDANPAVVGIILSYLIIRFPLQFAAGSGFAEALQSLMPVTPPPNGEWGTHLAQQWLPFATMVGWYMAAMFHKPDE
ncbi:MAG: hypothetical protein FJX72_07795 [Armatimonadetes bacterium]|nr:hypothetical protein [Armatimonadota bacterium]